MKHIVISILLCWAAACHGEEKGEKFFVDLLKSARSAVDSSDLDAVSKRVVSADPKFKLEPKLFERILKSWMQQSYEDPATMKLLKYDEMKDKAILVYRSGPQARDFVNLKAFIFEQIDNVWKIYFECPVDYFKTMGAEEDEKAIKQSLAENPCFDIRNSDPLHNKEGSFTASRHPGKYPKVNISEILETKWDALAPDDLVQFIQKQGLADQNDETRKQWQAWMVEIGKGAKDQRGELLKSGLLTSADGDCLIALKALSVLLDPVLSLSKRLDGDIRSGRDAKLTAAWKPVYELIQKEQFSAALTKVKEAALGEPLTETDYTQKGLKVLRARLEEKVQALEASKAAEKK